MKVTHSQLRKIIKEELQEEGIFDFLRRKKAPNWWANPNAPTGKSADGTQESRPADRKEYAAKIKEVARFLDSVNTGDMFFNYFEYPDRAGEVPLAIKQFNMELTPERRNELGANALSSVWSEEVRANSGRMLAQIVFDYIMASGDVQKITNQVKTYKGAGDRARGWMTLKRDFEKNRENYRAVKNAFDNLIAGKAPKKVMDAFKLSVLVKNFRLLEAAGEDFTSFYRTLLDLSDPKRSREIDIQLGVPEIEQKFDSDQEKRREEEETSRRLARLDAEERAKFEREWERDAWRRARDRERNDPTSDFKGFGPSGQARQWEEGKQMKITQSQLRQIIKEEIEAVLNEKAEKTVSAEISAQKKKGKPQDQAVAIALSKQERGEVRADEAMNEEELDERCQKGYKTHETRKTKTMYGKTYRNCVKAEQLELDEKKKKKGKDDRCTRIAKRKYDVWPSAYASGAVVKCRQGKIWKGVSEGNEENLAVAIRQALHDEGGAAGMDALVDKVGASQKEIEDAIGDMHDVGHSHYGDYILDDADMVDIVK